MGRVSSRYFIITMYTYYNKYYLINAQLITPARRLKRRLRFHWLRSLILSRRSCHKHRLQVFHSIQSVVMDKSYPLITWALLTLVEAPQLLP